MNNITPLKLTLIPIYLANIRDTHTIQCSSENWEVGMSDQLPQYIITLRTF